METSDFEVNNIEDILQSRENEEAFFQRLSAFVVETNSKVTTFIDTFTTKQKELKNKIKVNKDTISQLHNESKELDHQLQNTILSQKVVSKKIQNNNQQIEQLREEIQHEKNKKEELTLEMVDLEAGHEKAKEQKIKEWNALKKAAAVFKEKLNIHLDLKELDDHDCIKITYFFDQNPKKEYYYVQLLNYNNIVWRVQSIVPTLDNDQLKNLNIDLSKDYTLQDIIIFIPKIRAVFINQFFSP
ncbi:uncharacterized protein LOC103570112 [Microplitis demolitor]|uniref:uncharacterized protein LOC103570112 n=1 Tax=Microplitis demolitor TaxID=69319 RepID=UPI0004CD5643|nr:uncharacterized protein LOC103570112 [Microplitis demolitor]XP_053598949.1 uncharacterized protein LOC103570112 [Microplitis demolitor]